MDTRRRTSGSISRAPEGSVEGPKRTGQVRRTLASRSVVPVGGDGPGGLATLLPPEPLLVVRTVAHRDCVLPSVTIVRAQKSMFKVLRPSLFCT